MMSASAVPSIPPCDPLSVPAPPLSPPSSRRMFQSFSSFLQNTTSNALSLAQNVAQTAQTTLQVRDHSPRESVLYHWSHIEQIFAYNPDATSESQCDSVSAHLHEILKHIGDDTPLPDSDDGVGVCLDLFFEKRMLMHLVRRAQSDTRTMMRVVLEATTQLLKSTDIAMLPEASVHEPLSNLLSVSAKHARAALSDEDERSDSVAEAVVFLQLLNAVLEKIKQFPGSFVVLDPRGDLVNSVLHSALSVAVECIRMPGTRAKLAIKVVNNCIEIIPLVDPFGSYFVNDLNFPKMLAEYLIELLCRLPQSIDTFESAKEAVEGPMRRFLIFVGFYDTCVAKARGTAEGETALSAALLHHFRASFLDLVLRDRLRQSSPGIALAATQYTVRLLQKARSGSLGPLLASFLLGSGAQTPGGPALITELLPRVNSDDADMVTATLTLILDVLGTFSDEAAAALLCSSSTDLLGDLDGGLGVDGYALAKDGREVAARIVSLMVDSESAVWDEVDNVFYEDVALRQVDAARRWRESTDAGQLAAADGPLWAYLPGLILRIPDRSLRYTLILSGCIAQALLYPWSPAARAQMFSPSLFLSKTTVFGAVARASTMLVALVEQIQHAERRIVELTDGGAERAVEMAEERDDDEDDRLLFAYIAMREFNKELAAITLLATQGEMDIHINIEE